MVVGARSAIFAPLPRLGLVCVDEEHDSSYKQDADPRYDARSVAVRRAELEGAVCVFGSATPRPESWHRLERLELGQRLAPAAADGAYRRPPPRGRVPAVGAACWPSWAACRASGGGQAVLLLNRRGTRPALHCRACGQRPALPGLRRPARPPRRPPPALPSLRATAPAPSLCPGVRLRRARPLGAGTERLEQELAARLPELERFRLDADTAARRRPPTHASSSASPRPSARCCWERRWWRRGTTSRVSRLAAVIDADAGLLLPDFRAEERAFQLLTQLAGPERPRRPGARDRPDVHAGRAPDRACRPPRRGRVPRGGARAAPRARLSAVPAPRPGRRGQARPPEGPAALLAELRAGLEGDDARRRDARPGAAPAPSRPPPRRPARQDAASSGARDATPGGCLPPPRGPCARTASRPRSTSIRRAGRGSGRRGSRRYTATRWPAKKGDESRSRTRRRSNASTSALPLRQRPAVPGPRAANARARGDGLRQGARRARREDDAGHADRERHRASRRRNSACCSGCSSTRPTRMRSPWRSSTRAFWGAPRSATRWRRAACPSTQRASRSTSSAPSA